MEMLVTLTVQTTIIADSEEDYQDQLYRLIKKLEKYGNVNVESEADEDEDDDIDEDFDDDDFDDDDDLDFDD